MISFQQAQLGRRVYQGAGQSPNMGQVSARGAQGYLQRELRKRNGARPVGADGASDRRSGVASRALSNMYPNKGRPTRDSLSKNKGYSPPGAKPKPKGKKNYAKGKGLAGVTPPQTVTSPQVKINANGILELPYDQDLSMEAWGAVNESNNELLSLQQEEQQAALDAMKARRDTELEYGQVKTQTESANAGRGALYSSMHGKNISSNATEYTNRLADITATQAQSSASIAQRRAAIQTALNQQLAAQSQNYAHNLGAEQAGTLGYGKAEIKKRKRKPARRKGAKK